MSASSVARWCQNMKPEPVCDRHPDCILPVHELSGGHSGRCTDGINRFDPETPRPNPDCRFAAQGDYPCDWCANCPGCGDCYHPPALDEHGGKCYFCATGQVPPEHR